MRRFWIGLACYLVFDVFATWASVRWLKTWDRRLAGASFGGYAACSAIWLWSIAHTGTPGITRALAIYPVVALMATVLTGLVFSGERLSARAWIGVALGAASVLLLSIEEGHGPAQ